MRTIKRFKVNDALHFKSKLLKWSQSCTEVLWLDSNEYPRKHSSFDALLAINAFTSIKTDHTDAFNDLKAYQEVTKDWIFGYLTYDLKNDIEKLTSENNDSINFPELYFFQPQKLVFIRANTVEFHYLRMLDDEIENDFNEISAFDSELENKPDPDPVKIKLRIHKGKYYEKIHRILKHIMRGDIYEVNFCQEFYAENSDIDPLEVYLNLNKISKPPFATFLKIDKKYLLSASPERYLRKEGNTVISQPIKGTAKRATNIEQDDQLRKALENDPKERAENIMIVDLVRNDMSRFAEKGTVEVDGLCEIYSFEQVHQMISTVKAKVANTISPVELLRASFPMGSMTGAPKIAAMKIIEKLEVTKRGLYSGAVGYFSPEGDFDFNVIIRSILYDEISRYLSFSVGSAITAKSNAEAEYEECLIKAKAMRDVLEGN